MKSKVKTNYYGGEGNKVFRLLLTMKLGKKEFENCQKG